MSKWKFCFQTTQSLCFDSGFSSVHYGNKLNQCCTTVHIPKEINVMKWYLSMKFNKLIVVRWPYSDIDLGQHCLRYWIVACWLQAITWTNVDLSSVRYCIIHLRAISQMIPQPSIMKISLTMTYLKFHLNLPGVNELIWYLPWVVVFCSALILLTRWTLGDAAVY